MNNDSDESGLASSATLLQHLAMAKFNPNEAAFRTEAEKALTAGPFSVTDKPAPPPGGTLHDYWSIGPYWWPNPDSPSGLPYIRRDGHVNPDSRGDAFDRNRIEELYSAVKTLLDAWFVTRDDKYAARIVHLLRVFLLDDATRMNPSLTYGQAIPGICDGRGIGIIETVKFIDFIDAAVHLHQAGLYPGGDWDALRNWIGNYLDWLQSSPHGQDERAAKNNHGTWMDAQLMAFAIFTERFDLAREVALEVPARRIDPYITPDGQQPLELARTRSFTYSLYNLSGLVVMAHLARRVGVDLWHHRGADGQSILAAFEFLRPYGTGERPWPHLQINEITGEKTSALNADILAGFAALSCRVKELTACP